VRLGNLGPFGGWLVDCVALPLPVTVSRLENEKGGPSPSRAVSERECESGIEGVRKWDRGSERMKK